MTRKIEYTRTEAEFLLELLEQDGRGMALNLADDVRQTFGLAPRTSESKAGYPYTEVKMVPGKGQICTVIALTNETAWWQPRAGKKLKDLSTPELNALTAGIQYGMQRDGDTDELLGKLNAELEQRGNPLVTR